MGTAPGYKFALVDCPLSGKLVGNKKSRFAIKINEIHNSNWLALGICYKNVVAA
jgi:hypothetical protein